GTLSESAALVFAKLDSKVQNILLSADYADKLEKASAHYIKELAKQAQKQIDKASGTEGGSDKESEAGGKKKGKVKVNWRSPSDRNQVIRELAHIAFNKKNEGAEDARRHLLTLYWVRGHGEKIGDLSAKDMDTLIAGDNQAFLNAQKFAEEKEAKKREKEAAKAEKEKAKTEAAPAKGKSASKKGKG